MIAELTRDAINPALALLPGRMDSPEARVMLIAIGLQESGLTARRQFGGGPARGLLQFERGGGVLGVMRHVLTATLAREVCAARRCLFFAWTIWRALERDDVLAFAFARLLLYCDAAPLPRLDDPDGAWRCYLRCWRPGKPREAEWAANHATAVAFVTSEVEKP